MNILVVGSGGREHALIKALKKSPAAETIYALPGNGGIARDAVCVPIGAKDIPGIVAFARRHAIDFAVVAPDDPLALGAVDALEDAGIPAFGPTAAAARIEASKVFAKTLMRKYHIPTAACRVFDAAEAALAYVREAALPLVIKADGLALGKGVTIAQSRQEARNAVVDMMENKVFGDSGSRVVIEEYLQGPEVSVLAFTDGKTLKPMVASMDHKRALDGGQGPNTGGMGAIAPNPFYTPQIAARCMEEIFLPTIRAMETEGCPFQGCLYFGLMLTQDGPKVIEYNCRFGDPETQAVLPLLKSDLLSILRACREGTLEGCPVEFSGGASCCVVMASRGYPRAYETGFALSLTPDTDTVTTYVAGARQDEAGGLVTGGGRVLGVTAVGDTLEEAVGRAYDAVGKTTFENAYFRRDIGKKALSKEA